MALYGIIGGGGQMPRIELAIGGKAATQMYEWWRMKFDISWTPIKYPFRRSETRDRQFCRYELPSRLAKIPVERDRRYIQLKRAPAFISVSR
jgi:hypothetical protein